MTTGESAYRTASEELLAQGFAELAAGDARQASEKGWEAAAQMLKAVAEQRGWQHDSHPALFRVVGRLVQETGDQEINTLFGTAHALQANFYENWADPASVEDWLNNIEQFVGKLQAVCPTSLP